MKETQFDIGFDTGNGLWFIQSLTKTRWNAQTDFVNDSNISLNNVEFDTHAWADQKNIENSHGRIRFYEGNLISTKQSGYHKDSYDIQGKNNKLKFHHYNVESAEIFYNIKDYDWSILIGKQELRTQDIKGVITGNVMKNKKRIMLKNPDILYSGLITLINTDLKS